MEISEVILFYSKFSKESVNCVQFIQQNRMPVILIGLDSPEARQKAMTGQNFQIKNVPTLVVSYVNKEVQLYVGSPKIMKWFQNILKPENPPPNKREKQTSTQQFDDEEEEEDDEKETIIEEPKKSKNGKLKNTKKNKKNNKKENIKKEQKKKKNGKLKNTKKNKKKQKNNRVELVMDQEDNSQKSNNHFNGLSTARTNEKAGNSDVMNMARQMEMQRSKALGYKEE